MYNIWLQPEIRELQRSIKTYYNLSTACSIVYKYCTQPISKHPYSEIFKDPLDTKHKIFKNRQSS